jgi:2-C-methyl-D-erythritol 2,4-cyclodiphosphate synthase
MNMVTCAIGQDSHRFEDESTLKPLMLAGIRIDGCPGLAGNSDADVVLHALTNAVSGITGVNILGAVSDELCLKQKITDSRVYLRVALDSLGNRRVAHVSIAIEAARPHLAMHIPKMKESVSALLACPIHEVGITATTGEGLTAFGRGEGISVFAIITAETA